jgi:lipoprotein NlpD
LRCLGSIGAGLLCLLLAACAGTSGEHQEVYVVRPQDTLYSIAWRYGLDYHDLARWNNVGPDYRIAVGQVLVLSPGARSPTAPSVTPSSKAPSSNATSPKAPSRVSSPKVPPPVLSTPTSPAATPSTLKWTWPTDPKSAPRPVPGGGVLLPGQVGQDVRAASSGRVVYIGSGLRGYGNLIIIKHGENMLSAYAHNRETLVNEGQEVTLGQVIAHMGEGAPNKPVLYFEIRRNGKPVDPMPFLPKLIK